MSVILIVDDQASVREALSEWLSPHHRVDTVGSGEACLEALARESYDLVLLDERMPGLRGSEILRLIRLRWPDLQVIMMTAFGSVDAAVEAIRQGAADYLLKPVEPEALRLRIERMLGYREALEENRRLRQALEERYSFHSIVTRDATMKAVCDRIEAVARAEAPVLITGESGTGKELVARALHLASERAGRPFVTVPCGAVPDTLIEAELFGHEKGSFTGAVGSRVGRFEEAGEGTLFLDEIGELSPTAQVKFLHVLQERRYQRIGGTATLQLRSRIVSATNRNLDEAMEVGDFRQDLYYRINTVRIDIPALRNRRGDVALLSAHFLEHYAAQYGKPQVTAIEPEAARILQRHSWPGNVRELKGVIEQAVILCRGEAVGVPDLPDDLTARKGWNGGAGGDGRSFHQRMDDHGRATILEAIDRADGVKKDAAQALGLSQRALSHYLKKYGITT